MNIFKPDILKITDAEIVPSNKKVKLRGGLYIKFLSSDNLVKGKNVSLKFNKENHYFEVDGVKIVGDDLEITAIEVGYWARKFDRRADFDLRSLIGLPLEIINDKEIEAEISEMSCWC